jgi:type VI protein secretion system component VasK
MSRRLSILLLTLLCLLPTWMFLAFVLKGDLIWFRVPMIRWAFIGFQATALVVLAAAIWFIRRD